MPWLASPNYYPHLTHHFVSLKPYDPYPSNTTNPYTPYSTLIVVAAEE